MRLHEQIELTFALGQLKELFEGFTRGGIPQVVGQITAHFATDGGFLRARFSRVKQRVAGVVFGMSIEVVGERRALDGERAALVGRQFAVLAGAGWSRPTRIARQARDIRFDARTSDRGQVRNCGLRTARTLAGMVAAPGRKGEQDEAIRKCRRATAHVEPWRKNRTPR